MDDIGLANGPTRAVRRGDSVVYLPAGILEKWQTIVDTMAELVNVPAGLITRVDGEMIEVALSSRSVGNPFQGGEAEVLEGSGLFCETVIKTGRRLIVPDGSADPRWRDNSDVALGMIAYLGFPIRWPDHEPFGTICVLDSKANAYNDVHARLVEQFRDVIEHHLQLITLDSARQQAALADHDRQALALRCSEQRLRDAQAELARVSRLSAMGQFAGSVIHEINQPLAAMTASAEACLRWLDRDAPDVEAARAAAKRLFDASRRTSDVMAGLRSLARKAPLEPADLDLHEVIREVMMIAHDETEHARVEQQLALDPDARYVRGDRVQLQLVLHNLIRNAVDAMAGRLDQRRTLTVSTTRSGAEEIEVWVDDTGAGLTPDIAARLFAGSVTTKAQGMGMGLMICRSVIEAHDGRIAAQVRDDGPGARFVFTLPAQDF